MEVRLVKSAYSVCQATVRIYHSTSRVYIITAQLYLSAFMFVGKTCLQQLQTELLVAKAIKQTALTLK
jgi:hypothetical protein